MGVDFHTRRGHLAPIAEVPLPPEVAFTIGLNSLVPKVGKTSRNGKAIQALHQLVELTGEKGKKVKKDPLWGPLGQLWDAIQSDLAVRALGLESFVVRAGGEIVAFGRGSGKLHGYEIIEVEGAEFGLFAVFENSKSINRFLKLVDFDGYIDTSRTEWIESDA